VLGEKGLFKINDLTQDLFFYENSYLEKDIWTPIKSIKGVSEGKMIRYAVHRREPLKVELELFIQSIIKGNKVPVSGEDGLQALKIAKALIESGKTHKVIEVQNAS
jgi:predicted dehydrogenase